MTFHTVTGLLAVAMLTCAIVMHFLGKPWEFPAFLCLVYMLLQDRM